MHKVFFIIGGIVAAGIGLYFLNKKQEEKKYSSVGMERVPDDEFEEYAPDGTKSEKEIPKSMKDKIQEKIVDIGVSVNTWIVAHPEEFARIQQVFAIISAAIGAIVGCTELYSLFKMNKQLDRIENSVTVDKETAKKEAYNLGWNECGEEMSTGMYLAAKHGVPYAIYKGDEPEHRFSVTEIVEAA